MQPFRTGLFMTTDQESLLEYYNRELSYLRRMGAAFAEQYPKIAGRLELEADQCPDPHIERLIESFAFLTARIQHTLESEFPQLSSTLLGVLYPQFLNPVPSMTIARFDADPTRTGITSGHLIPKNTPLFALSEQGNTCRFRTCYPVMLWPVTVTYAGFESTDQFDFLDNAPNTALVLRIRIETPGAIGDLTGMHRLRFYISGDRILTNALYELIFCHVQRAAVLPKKGGRPAFLSDEAVLPVGFDEGEDVLPYPPNAHRGYRLLHEYFTFPKKFLFFDLDLNQADFLNAQGFSPDDQQFDILFMLDQMPGERLVIDRNTFCLGCSPVINLFKKVTDPIRVTRRLPEYPLNPDSRREKITEIHSILSVSASADARDGSTEVAPFFSFNHKMERKGQQAFWHANRMGHDRKDIPGTRMHISFVDLDSAAGRHCHTRQTHCPDTSPSERSRFMASDITLVTELSFIGQKQGKSQFIA
ncbi:MAG: hypothetical protein B6245_14085 [Desulfobacteraceae bacterium 4572_88]|nr:MAG: hypothetical protein B6245_14085 [Desulfobacteraceae bacterium 4572_88]